MADADSDHAMAGIPVDYRSRNDTGSVQNFGGVLYLVLDGLDGGRERCREPRLIRDEIEILGDRIDDRGHLRIGQRTLGGGDNVLHDGTGFQSRGNGRVYGHLRNP